MSVDYIVSSLPGLTFGAPAPMSRAKFETLTEGLDLKSFLAAHWTDLETQLRNAQAEARGGERWKRPATGCALYWKNRMLAAFQEKDVLKREELIDRVYWDAAGELTPPTSPLGKGALATYALRLDIALRRGKISTERGNAAFDRLTAETRI